MSFSIIHASAFSGKLIVPLFPGERLPRGRSQQRVLRPPWRVHGRRLGMCTCWWGRGHARAPGNARCRRTGHKMSPSRRPTAMLAQTAWLRRSRLAAWHGGNRFYKREKDAVLEACTACTGVANTRRLEAATTSSIWLTCCFTIFLLIYRAKKSECSTKQFSLCVLLYQYTQFRVSCRLTILTCIYRI